MEGDFHPTFIRARLSLIEYTQYLEFLRQNRDVFGWNYSEMPRLDPDVVVHHLTIDPCQQPIKQHPRKARHDIANKIEGEVKKLLKVRFICEVRYPKWLANIVSIQKKNGQIRVCIDYRDPNSACPKDDFPQPLT